MHLILTEFHPWHQHRYLLGWVLLEISVTVAVPAVDSPVTISTSIMRLPILCQDCKGMNLD